MLFEAAMGLAIILLQPLSQSIVNGRLSASVIAMSFNQSRFNYLA